ncbi:PREDICTED: tRNA(His) guanylyltransferase 1-like [Nelumbo nucifera]|uniref:tRNA(His) guanylyltransferase n=2 Tax=Nelumbo nucifera TaxID=4432 RepID=A0A1U8AME6_NELNU|nr:PREDICTED: tRNA(His) guanylyltransferase 1-like [Nelumbo nucifera]DAD22465.1 TPA_asm: hypothetical protein HUJ06_023928 [Nelumbo nucifera]
MANSKYEYVKSFEAEDKLLPNTWIVIKIGGHDFTRFSEVHEFMKPNDEQALNLMNSCAMAMLEEYPDMVLAYGFRDEYSFILKEASEFYQRRASKLVSVSVSFFSAVYVMKWKEFFPEKALKYPPSFDGQVFCCPSVKILKDYLMWRQADCHTGNQYNTCLWMLVKSGQTKQAAQNILEGTQKQEKNELLFQQFGINYDKLPIMFRKGSCVLRHKVEEIIKYNRSGDPVKRLRKKVMVGHFNLDSPNFWTKHPSLLDELGVPESHRETLSKVWSTKCENVKSFEVKNSLMPSTWVVVRIDGRHFHRFSEAHEFEKPNDEKALNLMNSCAAAVLEEFPDVVFSYGVSDEYSFVFKDGSQFCERYSSQIVSRVVSFFSSMYVMKWKEFFLQKELKYAPSFDGRAICYPSAEILQDYLAWRQVDCHINNQYNTCFWMLVKSGKAKSEAQHILKGTQTQEKEDLLLQQFGIVYNTLPVMFRKGSCVFSDKVEESMEENGGHPVEGYLEKVIVEHCDIIGSSFWDLHPSILSCNLSKHPSIF